MRLLPFGRVRRAAFLTCFSLAATIQSSPIYALATYAATTEATLLLRQILDVNMNELANIPEGLSIGALTGHAAPVMFDIGNADAHATPSAGLVNDTGPPNAEGYSPIDLPGGFHVSMQVDGTADQATPPSVPSIAQSLAQGGGSIGAVNTTADTYFLQFSFEWNYLLQTTLTDTSRERAFAHGLIRSWAIVTGAIGGPELFEFPDIEKMVAGNDKAMDFSKPGMDMIEIRLNPNRAVTLNLTVQSDGEARNSVPEPAGWPLVLVAAAIGCFRRWARKKFGPPSRPAGKCSMA